MPKQELKVSFEKLALKLSLRLLKASICQKMFLPEEKKDISSYQCLCV